MSLYLIVTISVCLCQGYMISDRRIFQERGKPRMKYILQWIGLDTVIFKEMGVGQKVFIERNCPHVNCYVTTDRNLLENITMFDVIAFSGAQMTTTPSDLWPKIRSPNQKYAYAIIESARNYPTTCNPELDGYFNWTWTYRLDSDSKWIYLVVTDLNGTIIGPSKEMHWIKHKDMLPVPRDLRLKLKKKTKLAAWFVSNCETSNNREGYITQLNKIFKKYYNRSIDIFGYCVESKCPRENEEACHKMIRDDYYFYMAFENSFAEDYVTEKVLHAMQNNAIPIVYGGANYSRFLPPGSYIDATNLTPYELTEKMRDTMIYFEKYVDHFRWRNHYKIHPPTFSPTTDWYCSICALINDYSKLKEKKVYKNFREWWNPGLIQTRWCWPNILIPYTALIKSIIDRVIAFPTFLFG